MRLTAHCTSKKVKIFAIICTLTLVFTLLYATCIEKVLQLTDAVSSPPFTAVNTNVSTLPIAINATANSPLQTAINNACSKSLQQCRPKVTAEIERSVTRTGPLDKDKCLPKLIKVPSYNFTAEQIGALKSECTGEGGGEGGGEGKGEGKGRVRDLVIEEYDFHTQYDCVMQVARRIDESSSTVIPRIGHAVYYHEAGSKMKFHEHVSMLSLARHLRPTAIFFWNDALPSGRWWTELLLRLCPRNGNGNGNNSLAAGSDGQQRVHFYSVFRQRPTSVYEKTIKRVEHGSDVVRLEALLLMGGVYLDFDAFAVNDLTQLLNESWVQGYETAERLSNSVLLGAPNAAFGTLWHCEYAKDFKDSQWLDHSVLRPHIVAERCAHTIRREAKSLCKPSNYPDGDGLRLLYGEGVYYNLSENYAVHTFMWVLHKQVDSLDPDKVLKLNTTLGRILSAIYFDWPLD